MIPAVGYLRRSTTKQEQSLDGQRHAIILYAERKGYRIIRWYIDDGISGSTGDERPQFSQMIRDAAKLRDFTLILAYDMSRFSRMDGDETGHYRYLLRQAGVRIEYSNELAANADDETSELIRPMLQAQKRQYLRQISRDTLRGQLQAVKAGWASGRAAAYGLDRLLVDAAGVPQKRLKRAEKWMKDRSWHIKLVPSDTPGEVETVQWMFKIYDENEIGLREIARRLNERGIKSPHNDDWSIGTVREMLRNPVYKGLLCFGRRAMGLFHRAYNGELKDVRQGEEGTCVHRPQETWITHKQPEMALVSEELWERVNAKIRLRGNRSRAARARKSTYLLSGLIRCGDCGKVMVGTKQSNVHRYFCSSYYKAKLCGCNTVYQEHLVVILKEMIKEHLFMGGNWEGLKDAIFRAAKNNRECRQPDAENTQRQLDSAREKQRRAAQNLLMADPENVPILNQSMNDLRTKIKALELEVQSTRQPLNSTKLADEVIAQAKTLYNDLLNSDGPRLKEVLSRCVDRITLRFGESSWGKRKIKVVTGCDVYLHAAASFTTGYRGGGI